MTTQNESTRKYEYAIGQWERDARILFLKVSTTRVQAFKSDIQYPEGEDMLLEALNKAGADGWHFCGIEEYRKRMFFMRKLED